MREDIATQRHVKTQSEPQVLQSEKQVQLLLQLDVQMPVVLSNAEDTANQNVLEF